MSSDLTTCVVGAIGWALAIPAVKLAGSGVSSGVAAHKALAIAADIGIAYFTTPLLASLMGWKSPEEKVRGVALVRNLE